MIVSLELNCGINHGQNILDKNIFMGPETDYSHVQII